MVGGCLFGPDPSVAGCYLFVMLLWAKEMDVEAPPYLIEFRDRMMARPAVLEAMKHEGLI
jgi:glutathione S-transferase